MRWGMNCNKARELYFAGRDGALDEIGRMKLERHLEACPACAAFVREAEASLELLKKLPEEKPSEGFEWNVKRRILQEKTRMIRRTETPRFGERWWAGRFAIGAAAAIVVVGLYAFSYLERGRERVPSVKSVSVSARESDAGTDAFGRVAAVARFANMGAAPGVRMVSGDVSGGDDANGFMRPAPFRLVPVSKQDSLIQENDLLRSRIAELERQVAVFRGILYQQGRRAGAK